MIYTLVFALIEKLNKDNEARKVFEANEKERKEREREAEELVIWKMLIGLACYWLRLIWFAFIEEIRGHKSNRWVVLKVESGFRQGNARA